MRHLIYFLIAFMLSSSVYATTLQGDGLHGAFTRENFLKQGDAEIIVTGISHYVNAGAVPTTCSGGLPTSDLTVTREKSKAMSGNFYWKITKASGDQQGRGVAFDFEVDGSTSSGQLQQEVSVLAKTISGTFKTGENSDIGIYLYDVDAEKLISLAGGNDILGPESKRWFSPTKNSTKYRLCAHVQTVSTEAYTLGLDNIAVGKAGPVATGDVNNTFTAKVNSVGVIVDQTGPHRDWLTSCAPQNDTTFICTYRAGLFSSAPSCFMNINDPAGSMPGQTRILFSSASGVTVQSASSSGVKSGFNISCTRTGSDYVKGAELADSYTGRDIFSTVVGDGTGTPIVTSGINFTKISNFSNPVSENDPFGMWDSVNKEFVIPTDGDLWSFTTGIRFDTFVNSASPGYANIAVFINGVNNSSIGLGQEYKQSTTPEVYPTLSGQYKFKKGDRISIRGRCPDFTSCSAGKFNTSYFSITRINSSQTAFRPDTFYPADVVNTETQVGWDRTVTPPKPIYKRCHKVESDITVGDTITTFPANLTILNGLKVTSNVYFIKGISSANKSDVVNITYSIDTGNISSSIAGTGLRVAAGEVICIEYLKP